MLFDNRPFTAIGLNGITAPNAAIYDAYTGVMGIPVILADGGHYVQSYEAEEQAFVRLMSSKNPEYVHG